MNLGNRIKKRRQELDMTQDELALKMGCSKSAISKVETGKDNMSTERLQKFADALDTTVNSLMGWDDGSSDIVLNLLPEVNASQSIDSVSSILRSVSKMLQYFSMFNPHELELIRKVLTDDDLRKRLVEYCEFLVQTKDKNKD